MDLSNVTVAIPLYQSLKYSDIIIQNIDRLVNHCKVIVSDPSESDSLLLRIESHFQGKDNLRVIGKRTLEKGWVTHWNDLMNEVDTKYFMWLSHDDEIDLDWVVENLRNLLTNPNLAGSFGLLDRILDDGSRIEYGERLPTSNVKSREFKANQLLESWHLGIATRALWDKSKVLPMLNTWDPFDEWADIIWVYGILLEHNISQIDTVSYGKRYYAGSTHSFFRPFNSILARELLIREINRRNLPLGVIEELLQINQDLLTQVKALILNSRSWKLIKPFRPIIRFFKSL